MSDRVVLRREPVESLLNSVSQLLPDLPEGHALREAYRAVNQELRGEEGPQGWHGPGGTSGGRG